MCVCVCSTEVMTLLINVIFKSFKQNYTRIIWSLSSVLYYTKRSFIDLFIDKYVFGWAQLVNL